MAVEHAPPGTRGYYGSWPQIGVPAGLVLSTGVFAVFSQLPEAQFLAWGWRVPFLLSALLVIVGLMIRVRILETPAFTKVKEEAREARQPILEVLTTYPKQVLLAMGARFAENGAFYIYSVFVLTYATQQVKMPQQVVLNGILIGAGRRTAGDPVLRRPVGSGRATARVSVRGGDDRAVGVPVVLAARYRVAAARVAGVDRGLRVLARGDVWPAGGVPLGTVRHTRSLQRRVTGRATRGRACGWHVPVHRHAPPCQTTVPAPFRST